MATISASRWVRWLRRSFGISAPKVAVRMHVPWYWRALSVVALLALSLALGLWIYDAGRQIAGYDSSKSARRLDNLKAHVGDVEDELATTKSQVGVTDANLKIERATQEKMVQHIRTLEAENAALKQDLAFFEGLLPGTTGTDPGVRISRLEVDRENADSPYRYRMLVVYKAPKPQGEFKGELQFSLRVQQDGKDVMINVPSGRATEREQFRLEIKYYQRAEGLLNVPDGAILKSVEARVVQSGVVRARQTVNL